MTNQTTAPPLVTAPSFAFGSVLTCPVDEMHRLVVVRASDGRLLVRCAPCGDNGGTATIGLANWYDNQANLSVLVDWLGDMSPSGFRHVIEKPWNYEGEFRVAVDARAHEHATDHTVYKGDDDTAAYCNDCVWTRGGEQVPVLPDDAVSYVEHGDGTFTFHDADGAEVTA